MASNLIAMGDGLQGCWQVHGSFLPHSSDLILVIPGLLQSVATAAALHPHPWQIVECCTVT